MYVLLIVRRSVFVHVRVSFFCFDLLKHQSRQIPERLQLHIGKTATTSTNEPNKHVRALLSLHWFRQKPQPLEYALATRQALFSVGAATDRAGDDHDTEELTPKTRPRRQQINMKTGDPCAWAAVFVPRPPRPPRQGTSTTSLS